MVARIDRTGEEGINNFNSKMVIIKYVNQENIDVYFPEYDWIAKNKQYCNFKRGYIKCPYERRFYDEGYLGEGKYKPSENGKDTKYYKIWYGMLQRCYDDKLHKRQPRYKDCYVEDYWLDFQNICEWLDENYYEVQGERMHLDKDILLNGNKMYSRNTCLIVPQRINSLFIYKKNKNSDLPHGIHRHGSKYRAMCSDDSKKILLGTYKTIEEAFAVYKEFKESVIKQVSDEYYSKGLIPKKVYDALYNYEVLITD